MWTSHWTRIQCAALLLLGAAATPAMAQPSPGEVARRSIEQIRGITADCVENLRATAGRAGHRIDDLQADGNDLRARFVAKQASDRVGELGRECVARIHGVAARSVRALRELGADQALIDAVRGAAARGKTAIQGAVEAARKHIAEALAT
jgi:hypothetical protein